MQDHENSFTLYGIKNCDTIKKARRWLDERQVSYRFHDYRVEGVDSALLRGFAAKADWKILLNSRGTTWRRLSEAERQSAESEEGALAIMLAQPAMIKRPILLAEDGRMLVGFDSDKYRQLTGKES